MISMVFFSVWCCRSVSCWLALLRRRAASEYSTRELSVISHLASHRAMFALAFSISDSLSRFDSCLPSFFPFLYKKMKRNANHHQHHKVKLCCQIRYNLTVQILKTGLNRSFSNKHKKISESTGRAMFFFLLTLFLSFPSFLFYSASLCALVFNAICSCWISLFTPVAIETVTCHTFHTVQTFSFP